MDLAVFALNTSLDPQRLQTAFERVISNATDYDLVFIDHRSGIASSVLPLVSVFPGPTIVCMRLDEQSDEADAYVAVLLNRSETTPGLFVSFSLDPEDTAEKMQARSGARIESLLDILAQSIMRGSDSQSDDTSVELTPDTLKPYWVSWFHDRSFLGRPDPAIQDLSTANRDALSQIRELLGLTLKPKASERTTSPIGAGAILTNSGSTDEGMLIETDALRKLRAPNSSYRYIFGRKGTGKTRLVRTLVAEGLGEPLLSAEDDGLVGSISSANPVFLDLSAFLFENDAADKLWWIVLDCALQSPSLETGDRLQWWLDRLLKGGRKCCND